MRDYGLKLLTPAAELCVSLGELREHVGYSDDNHDHDAKLYACAADAEDYCQKFTGRQFVSATWQLSLDRWPARRMNLPRAPLASVTSVKYLDPDGVEQTWGAANYRVIDTTEPGYIVPEFDIVYPAIRPIEDAIKIAFVAGYGEPVQVPEMLRNAVLLLAQQRFDFPAPTTTGAAVLDVPWSIRSILEMYKVPDDWLNYARAS